MDYVNSVDMAWFFGGGCVYLIVTVGCFRLLVCSFDGFLGYVLLVGCCVNVAVVLDWQVALVYCFRVVYFCYVLGVPWFAGLGVVGELL